MQRRNALIAGVIGGIESPGSIGVSVNYPLPKGTDLQRMRADVERLGLDFSTVIRRENGKHQATPKPDKG